MILDRTEGIEWRELLGFLRESDFITLHTPLTDKTYHFIGEKELSLMKPTAYLINTSRGPILDEKALVFEDFLTCWDHYCEEFSEKNQ